MWIRSQTPISDKFDASETSENLESTQNLVYLSKNKEIWESEESEIQSTNDVFPDSMLFDVEIINEITHKVNQEEDISFDIICIDVETVLSELVRKVEDQISKLKKKNLTRKQQMNKDNWVRNKRKKSHQQGKSYINSRGKQIYVKSIKTTKDCKNACKFNCTTNIDEVAKEKIYHDFYYLDTDGKHTQLHRK